MAATASPGVSGKAMGAGDGLMTPTLAQRIGEILREIQASEGLAVLLAEQNATWALSLARRAVILDLGKVSMTGDAAQLLDDPAVRKAYLGI